jgi:hypothetical protein
MRLSTCACVTLFMTVLLSAPAWGLSTEEVVYLKQQGVSDETIHIMLHNAREKEKLDTASIRITGGENATTWSTGTPFDSALSEQQRLDVERAWNMLDTMLIDIGPGRR